MSTQALRWGIVGTGLIADMMARDLTLPDARADHVITAVGSRSQESADRFADTHGIAHRHASYEALVADDDVDIVYVATPHPMHHHDALLALDAGKHVLVEKAFTMTSAEARDIVGRAAQQQRFCMEAMWTRFLPHMVRVREYLANGALGTIVSVTDDHGQWFPQDPGFRLFAPELGGGAMLDLGVYPVSFASMVLGPPERTVALVDPAFNGVVDGQTSMIFGYARGAQAQLTCTSAALSPTRASIVGTEGRIEIDTIWYSATSFTFHPRVGEPVREHPAVRGRGMIHQADECKRRIDAGDLESDIMPLAETIAIMSTMEDVLRGAGF